MAVYCGVGGMGFVICNQRHVNSYVEEFADRIIPAYYRFVVTMLAHFVVQSLRDELAQCLLGQAVMAL